MIWIFMGSLGWGFAIAMTFVASAQARRWERCYRYAVARADFTEGGRAYSDMATTLVLGGRPREANDAAD